MSISARFPVNEGILLRKQLETQTGSLVNYLRTRKRGLISLSFVQGFECLAGLHNLVMLSASVLDRNTKERFQSRDDADTFNLFLT